MPYNPYLFDKIYNNCCDIINQSKDKNIKLKKHDLDFAYDKVEKTNNCEVQEFFAVTHELRTYELLQKINKLPFAHKDSKRGVDFFSKLGNIECVTFQNPSDVTSQQILNGTLNHYKAYEPRITQALNSKLEKYVKYTNEQKRDSKRHIIELNKPNIICLNLGICGYRMFPEDAIRACEKILYGIGFDTLVVDIKTQYKWWSRSYEEKIIKPNGKEIPINFFSKEEYKIIGGVLLLYQNVDEPYTKPILYINPKANIMIDKRQTKKLLCLLQDTETRFHYSLNGQPISINQYRGIK